MMFSQKVKPIIKQAVEEFPAHNWNPIAFFPFFFLLNQIMRAFTRGVWIKSILKWLISVIEKLQRLRTGRKSREHFNSKKSR